MRKLSDITGISPENRTFQRGEVLDFTGLYGVEIELENLPGLYEGPPVVNQFWRIEEDGSLRNNGREFVLHKPLTGVDLELALASVSKFLDTKEPSKSRRTSVHVHMDVSNLDFAELMSLFVYYTLFEKVLFRYVGIEREDNVYCIPFYRGMDHFDSIARALRLLTDGQWSTKRKAHVQHILSTYNKYSSLNLAPVTTLGSVEFRHHPGEYKYSRLSEWVRILNKLKEFAVANVLTEDTFYDPLQDMSVNGPEYTVERVFGKELAQVLITPETGQDLYVGARTAQEFIFAKRLAMGSVALVRWLRDKFPKKETPEPHPAVKKKRPKRPSSGGLYNAGTVTGTAEYFWPGAVQPLPVEDNDNNG